MTTRYGLYVPAEHARHDLRAASAIVGEPMESMIDTHYEGGGNATNVTTFEHRINQAAGRRRQSYPTSARRAWGKGDVIEVGSVVYDEVMPHWVIETITDPEALRRWVGTDEPLQPGGSDELIKETGAMAFSRLNATEQRRVRSMRLPMTALCAEVLDSLRRNCV